MALEGCIGDKDLRAWYSIARFKLFESGLEGDEFGAELDRLWKVRHGHDKSPQAPKCRVKHPALPAGQKWCNGCERSKSRSEFSTDRSRKDGLNNRCRECASRYFKQTQSQRCKVCDGYSIGTTCARCYRLGIVLREHDSVVMIIPRMLLAWREANLSIEAHKTYKRAVELAEMAVHVWPRITS